MRFKKDNAAFTLVEVIVVIIIAGILITLALPRYFKMIELSRVAEAQRVLGLIKNGIERCYYLTNDLALCAESSVPGNFWEDRLHIEDPNTTPGTHFTYWAVSGSLPIVYLFAQRNLLDGGDQNDQIVMFYDFFGGKYYWAGYGRYVNYTSPYP